MDRWLGSLVWVVGCSLIGLIVGWSLTSEAGAFGKNVGSSKKESTARRRRYKKRLPHGVWKSRLHKALPNSDAGFSRAIGKSRLHHSPTGLGNRGYIKPFLGRWFFPRDWEIAVTSLPHGVGKSRLHKAPRGLEIAVT